MLFSMREEKPLFYGRSLSCNATLEQTLSACRTLLNDMTFPTVKLWRENGGMVLGHFQVYFPEEIAHAAGMLPLKLGCTDSPARQGNKHFGSYLCSLVKNAFNLANSHCIELDMFATASICDAARNIAVIWSRNFSYPCRTLYLPQNRDSAGATDYLHGEYRELAAAVVEVTGCCLDNEELKRSIAAYNRNRNLLRRLYSLRCSQPWKLSVAESYLLTAVGSVLPRQEHNRLLEAVLPQLAARPATQDDKIRVVLNGCFCEQPPLEMLEAISRTCHVVDDDLLIGLRWITGDVDLHGDPLAALGRAYCEQSAYSPVQHDRRKSGSELLLQRVRQSAAQATIITAPKMCEPGLEEMVPLTAALDQAAIPYCVCEFEQAMTSFDLLELQLETFAENILYGDSSGEV
jgi:benzoyl-CoA reductase subunit C